MAPRLNDPYHGPPLAPVTVPLKYHPSFSQGPAGMLKTCKKKQVKLVRNKTQYASNKISSPITYAKHAGMGGGASLDQVERWGVQEEQ